MADLVVKDLQVLVDDLNRLIGEFEGALDFQNEDKRHWGQLNANLSMGDFAANWTVHRNAMVDDMKSLRDAVSEANKKWTEEDQQMSDSLNKS